VEWRYRDSEGVYISSPAGYRVVVPIGRKRNAVFLAFEPEDMTWRTRLQSRYRVGERVPTRFQLIGGFKNLVDAQQACEQHWEGRYDVEAAG